jgi:hypothetical protein
MRTTTTHSRRQVGATRRARIFLAFSRAFLSSGVPERAPEGRGWPGLVGWMKAQIRAKTRIRGRDWADLRHPDEKKGCRGPRQACEWRCSYGALQWCDVIKSTHPARPILDLYLDHIYVGPDSASVFPWLPRALPPAAENIHANYLSHSLLQTFAPISAVTPGRAIVAAATARCCPAPSTSSTAATGRKQQPTDEALGRAAHPCPQPVQPFVRLYKRYVRWSSIVSVGVGMDTNVVVHFPCRWAAAVVGRQSRHSMRMCSNHRSMRSPMT